jgi:hypothetical protein
MKKRNLDNIAGRANICRYFHSHGFEDRWKSKGVQQTKIQIYLSWDSGMGK